jgi:D-alanyl-D-alanine carboxypeptidase
MRSSSSDYRLTQLQHRLDVLHQELATLKPAIEALRSAPAAAPSKSINWGVFVPVIVALVGIMGTAAATFLQARSNLALEARKLESNIILQAITNTDTNKIINNLDLFAELGLISISKDKLDEYRKNPAATPGVAPASFQSGYDAALRNEVLSSITFQDDPTNPGFVKLDEDWEAKNIVRIAIPQLVGVQGFPASGLIKFNVRCATGLQEAFAEIQQQNLLHLVRTWDGGFVPRKNRGTNKLSTYATGLAFDINVKWNQFGRKPPADGEEGTLVPLVPIFEKHGFLWGGTIAAMRNPARFECARESLKQE